LNSTGGVHRSKTYIGFNSDIGFETVYESNRISTVFISNHQFLLGENILNLRKHSKSTLNI
jgi:hypothetical protein